jgi:2-succinyl-5-enolpyruvyl-6-hydroxy-3-cyclohexene-1-carboxylate synthase
MTATSVGTARVIVDELIRLGIREAVLAPGSRNAPLSYALHDAERAGRLRLHVRIDERSAAFLALGLAKASGIPVPVVCTSGTAVANLHPAVLEASHSDIPLIALTADRPGELFGSGANQTTDQARLFGSAARWSITVSTGQRESAMRSALDRAVGWATGAISRDPGPVQVNVAFSEPLVPDADRDGDFAPARGDGPWTMVSRSDRAAVREPAVTVSAIGPQIELTARTVVVVGDAAPALGALAAEFAARNGLPLIAEPSAGAWAAALGAAPLILASGWLARHRPDQAIVVGRPTLSRPVRQLLADPAIGVVAVGDSPRWADASLAVRAVLPASALSAPATGAAPPPEWLADWRRAEAAADAALEAALPGTWPSGPAVVRALCAALPPRAVLVLGSSSPVRDVEIAARPRADLLVLANRGLAGIDGTVSTAIGVALSTPDRPAYALMGDLTFLHDANGLLIGPREPRPDLAIVVINDDGGGIFSLLEQGGMADSESFERVFGTPHGADLSALCAATGTSHLLVSTLPDLEAAIESPIGSGIRVIEVRMSRTSLRDVHSHLAERVSAALDS